MRVSKVKHSRTIALVLIMLGTFSLLFVAPALADERKIIIPAQDYQSAINEDYTISREYSTSSFYYGKTSIGNFFVSGDADQQGSIKGFSAISAKGQLTIGYEYDGSFQTDDKEQWNITSDSTKSVNGLSLSGRMQDGAMLILKSNSGSDWDLATEPIRDFYSAKKLDRSNLYSISEEELKTGTYYRIILAYKMQRKTGEEPAVPFVPWPVNPIYEYNYCIEIYEFFAYLGRNPVTFRDILSGQNLSNNASVKAGFVVEKNGSTDLVAVIKENGTRFFVNSLASVVEKGSYTIEIKDPLDNVYTTSISVSEGMQTVKRMPVVFENEKKKEYQEINLVSGYTSFGAKSHTSLMIGDNSDTAIKESKRNGYSAFGVSGTNVYLFLSLVNEDYLAKNGWEIVSDSWGKKDSQTIAGAYTGQVDTGALILQTSFDGNNWQNVDYERYANGLYTTDFEHHYGNKGNVLIYQPSGEDVVRGIYVRVIYAYEIKQSSSKSDYRYIEKYEFYLCCNELDAVTYHNLSAKKEVSDVIESYDKATAAVYQHAETMLSGSYTVSGFSVDTTLNPTVAFTVKRNGQTIAVPSNRTFTSTGRYDIELTSAVNDKKTVTIFVDRMNTEEALQYYFGESFINGKRIYSEGSYPVFEGGKTNYNLNPVGEYHLPLGGYIRNLSTGAEIIISADRSAKQGVLSEPGEYVAVFTTNSFAIDAASSGDCREFTFRFNLIAEGTAPGPIVNRRSLDDYARSTLSDAYPVFYGLTYTSAGKGNITVAFATREAALEYAYNYEKGTVEQQSDGSYRYTGSFYVGQKEKIESNWDLTDAIYYFAEQAVQPLIFDFSDEYTVLTLPDEVLEKTQNLRTLELDRSVTIFADGQKKLFMGRTELPLISNKPYYYLTPGIGGKVISGASDFQFIRDKYGCDSNSVVIIDENGRKYAIRYEEGVGSQLLAQGCPSGILTIHEETVYGDQSEYQAIYIADNENTAQITLSLFKDRIPSDTTITQTSDDLHFEGEAFSIASIEDRLDPLGIVTIHCDVDSVPDEVFSLDQIPNKAWATPGNYTITLVNRLGFEYSIGITVTESDFATIVFEGEGTSDADYILTAYGETNVKLPKLTRYGYEHAGYEDAEGNQYREEVEIVSFRGSKALRALWEAKQYTLILKDSSGNTFSTLSLDFGKEYELPSPVFEDVRFLGWIKDGKLLDKNTITLDKEQDLVLIAAVEAIGEKQYVPDNTSEPDKISDIPVDEPEEKQHGSNAIILILLICAALAITGFIGWKVVVQKRKDCEQKGEQECDDPIAQEENRGEEVCEDADNEQ